LIHFISVLLNATIRQEDIDVVNINIMISQNKGKVCNKLFESATKITND